MKRLAAYAEAFGINTAFEDQDIRGIYKAADDGANALSTTGTVRDSFDHLKDGEMLRIPIGGDTGDFE